MHFAADEAGPAYAHGVDVLRLLRLTQRHLLHSQWQPLSHDAGLLRPEAGDQHAVLLSLEVLVPAQVSPEQQLPALPMVRGLTVLRMVRVLTVPRMARGLTVSQMVLALVAVESGYHQHPAPGAHTGPDFPEQQ